MKKLWNILGMIGERKKYVFLLILRIPVDFALNLSQVYFLRDAFIALENGNRSDLYRSCVIYALVSILIFTYNSNVWRQFAVMNIQIAGKIRIAAANSIMDYSLSQVERGTSGDFMTRLNLDAGMTIQILGGALNIPHFVIAVFNAVFSSLLMAGMNIKIFLIVMAFVIPQVLLSWYFVARPMTNLQDRVQRAKGKMNTILSAMITMADTASLYDANTMLMNNYRKESREVVRLKMLMILRNTFNSGMIPLLGFMAYLILLLYAGGAIAEDKMQFGDLTAISKLQNGILLGLTMGVNSLVKIRMNMAGLHRMNAILSKQEFEKVIF